MGDAEALLLVYYAKPQILKFHILLQNTVSSDNYIHLSAFQAANYFLLLLRSAEAGSQLHGYGEPVHALHKGLVVLPREYGGGNEHRHLLSVHNSLECGADSHLRFAEAHVSAEKSVHGARHFHIVLDFVNAAKLVVGFLVGEAFLKVPLPIRIRRESVSLGVHTLGIEGNKLLCHILYGGANSAAGALPLGGIELVELYAGILPGTHILRHKVKLGHGNIEHIRSGVANCDVILNNAADVLLHYALENADSVGDVNHIIAGGNIGEAFERIFGFFELAALVPL